MKKMIRAAALLAAAAAVSLPAAAQFAKAEDAINYRQSAFAVETRHVRIAFGRLVIDSGALGDDEAHTGCGATAESLGLVSASGVGAPSAGVGAAPNQRRNGDFR